MDPTAPLFRFCVIGDTHVKPESGDDSSPWKVNEYSAGRSRYAMQRLEALAPELVVNLGDLVHPVPDLPTYGPAAELVKAIYAGLDARLHVIPGNHDIGDKPGRTLPAKTVQSKWIAQWSSYFGASWQAFVHREVLFVLLNNPVFNSGLPEESAQRAWLEDTLRAHEARRKFVFLHYAPFLLDPDEPPNYDNVDAPARAWLFTLFARHGVEAVFAGHVHNYFYGRHEGVDYYIAPSIAFVRQDFSEMFRAAPLPEHENGRDDAAKLGFFEVAVLPEGHSVRFIATGGASLAEGARAAMPERLDAQTCRERVVQTVGVGLRHPWAELCDLPMNGPMDEFIRKRARNDYAFLAVQRMGIRSLRVPLADVLDARVRARMADLAAYGHRFVVVCFEPPDGGALEALRAARDCIEAIEIVLPWPLADGHAAGIARARSLAPVILSKVASSADGDARKSKFLLYVSSGFLIAELGEVPAGLADAVSVRIESEGVDDIAAEVRDAAQRGRQAGHALSMFLRLAARTPAPARDRRDDRLLARQVADFALAVWAEGSVTGWVDTLQDVDRGYFVRHGLTDRRLNLRLAGRAIMHLNAALTRYGPARDAACIVHGETRALPAWAREERAILFDLDSGCRVAQAPALGIAIRP